MNRIGKALAAWLCSTVAIPTLACAQGDVPAPTPVLNPQLAIPGDVPSHLPGTPAPIFPRLNVAVRAPHQAVPVPPTLEIEVLDPNVDPRGNPAVLTRPTEVWTHRGPQERLAVDIPPTVLVHRYYYTGDRSFQAPLLPGGPSVVVVNHPRTGERLYLPVQMLPGAPRVTYTDSCIEYDYGTQGITIKFAWICGPKVVYRNGVPVTTQVKNVAVRTTDATRRFIERTGLPECQEQAVGLTHNVLQTSADRVRRVCKTVTAPPIAILQMTPLSNLFTTSEEERASSARDAAVSRARNADRRYEGTIRTVR